MSELLFKRKIGLLKLLEQNSVLLFGARGTGKSFWMAHELQHKATFVDLLESDLYLRLSTNPSELEGIIKASKHKLIVIDEIQKIPPLLDEIHRLIEKKKYRFLLTGSSARKLKRGHANLLAGRAWTAEMYPISWSEMESRSFNLERYLRYGGLPRVLLSTNPEEELHAYVNTYIREEVQAEALVRKLASFNRFLKVAALVNGEMIQFTNVANDAAVPLSTVKEYFSILQDTLLGFLLEAWAESKKRKAIQTAKFYFFDTGVANTLAGNKTLDRNSNLFGKCFEQFIAMELKSYLSYRRSFEEMHYWRATSGQEVDFLIGNHTAVEVKSTARTDKKDLKGLLALKEEKVFKNFFLVCNDHTERVVEGIRIIHWEKFLGKLWADELF